MLSRALLRTGLALSMYLGTGRAEPLPVERYCEGHAVQEAFLADDSRVRVLICGRRTGKTVVLRVEAIRAALAMKGEPDLYVVYITNTLPNGKRQFWKPLKRLLRDLGHRFTANDSDYTIELDGAGSIRMASASDLAQIERIRGDGSPLVIIDECGTYTSDLLLALVTECAEPMTLDVGGRIIFAGTPGPTLAGYWYQKSGPAANGAIYRGDLFSNPHLMRNVPAGPEREAAIRAFLESVRTENSWSETHPTFVREWLGLWAQDDEALVFPLAANRNDYQPGKGPHGLPTHTDTGNKLSLVDWRTVIAVDVGYTAANGYVVMATHPSLRRTFILRTYKRREQLIEPMALELRTLRVDYAIQHPGGETLPAIVIDAGGMGKIHAETLGQKMGLPVTPADKREKGSSIATTRDDVIGGRIVILRADQWGDDPCIELVSEWQVLVWNKDRDGIADGQEDHLTDACLYGARYLRNHTRLEQPTAPERGTSAWQAQEKQRMVEKLQSQARRRRRSKRAS